jgi:hypothetical protein
VFLQQRVPPPLRAGDIVHNWEVEQGWGFGLLPPRDSLDVWGVWECYKGGHGERALAAAIHIHSSSTASQRMKKSRSLAHTLTNFQNIDLQAHMHKSLYSAEVLSP